MGYFTQYSLEVRKIKDENQFSKLFEELNSRDLIGYAFEQGTYNEKTHEAYFFPYEEVKWYDHSVDMVGIAEKFPDMYFLLEGTGEDFGDFWREYYHDMDIEQCRGDIIYEKPKKVQWDQLIMF